MAHTSEIRQFADTQPTSKEAPPPAAESIQIQVSGVEDDSQRVHQAVSVATAWRTAKKRRVHTGASNVAPQTELRNAEDRARAPVQ